MTTHGARHYAINSTTHSLTGCHIGFRRTAGTGDESAAWYRGKVYAFMSVVWSYFSEFGGQEQLVSFPDAGAHVCIFCA